MAAPTLASVPGIRDEVATLKRERTLSAAVDLFYERGYENTTLDAVAERLGVTKPFIYAHFHSKAELLTEICTRGIASALDAIERALSSTGSPTEKLRALGEHFTLAVLQSQMHIAIFAREEKNLPPADFDRISTMRRRFDRKLVALLREGVASGEFTVPDPEMAALAIGGMVSWAYVWYRPNGRLPLPAVAGEMSGLILSMAGAKPAPARRAAAPRRAAARR
ncbi:TetR/AcrR family transcriptional regulator [Roseomonas haemaphysalidis]|uniref:TetR/AcrR family transcriptional regulator n=1 Tax=Roseomonas haemaphysalidis TaxID=2768162 RepID=A0ABS3KV13_9PROT|nr:TetR/AcrR family transcriptional regulator [Roseomonas haemaphysalidis]MBO1081325.1 TetR/AcrR family transcriptional regulator [Roseomonas haemaphysalidis]